MDRVTSHSKKTWDTRLRKAGLEPPDKGTYAHHYSGIDWHAWWEAVAGAVRLARASASGAQRRVCSGSWSAGLSRPSGRGFILTCETGWNEPTNSFASITVLESPVPRGGVGRTTLHTAPVRPYGTTNPAGEPGRAGRTCRTPPDVPHRAADRSPGRRTTRRPRRYTNRRSSWLAASGRRGWEIDPSSEGRFQPSSQALRWPAFSLLVGMCGGALRQPSRTINSQGHPAETMPTSVGQAFQPDTLRARRSGFPA